MSIQEMGRNITLVGTRLCWSDALLYCRDSHWDLLSLVGPEDQEMVDKLVARAPFPLTSHLWVGLRRSLSGSSWFWMSGDPMDFTQWDEGSHHSSPCGGVSSRERSTWRQRSCEEHLNFICFTADIAEPTPESRRIGSCQGGTTVTISEPDPGLSEEPEDTSLDRRERRKRRFGSVAITGLLHSSASAVLALWLHHNRLDLPLASSDFTTCGF
ncbi:unnamed protein product [Gadus morhua 'NCC']